MNLKQLQRDAREEARVADWATHLSGPQYHEVQQFLDTLIEKVVSAVEESVRIRITPEDADVLVAEMGREKYYGGYLRRDEEVDNAFKTFRNHD
ncbi:hypothetical protein C4568_03635 [Candidatus Parcubacteria bacterium]|nr:MAG: hypothetical protein C4568_03635 [Candidatus Parcubacteria bacterium]